MYMAHVLTVAYSPKVSLPIAFTCMVSHVRYIAMLAMLCYCNTHRYELDHENIYNGKLQHVATVHGEHLVGQKLANLVNHELFANIFCTNLHSQIHR